MSIGPSPPTAATITGPQFAHALSLYPATVARAYGRNARLREPKKLSDALDDDAWRYDQLPRVLAARGAGGTAAAGGGGGPASSWLEKGELERLVAWKITHGAHRPFLPSLIRQNADEAVKSATGSAFSSIPPSSTGRPTKQPYPEAALTSLTKALKGVGPATATLLLSVHDPDGTPFFSDELYAWLVDGAAGPPRSKLKYDAKEYRRLYEAWVEFRRRAIQDKEEGGVRAVDVEKAAFVLGHWEFLDGDERRRAAGMERGDEDAAGGEREDGVPRAPAAAGKAKRKKASEPVGRPGKETDAANGQRQLRDNDDDDDDDDEDGIRIRRSKRSRNVK